MGSIFGPFFNVEPMAHPLDGQAGDVTRHIMDNIARDVQVRLKSRLDTGIVMGGVTGVQKLKVVNAGEGLEITGQRLESDPNVNSVHDLFSKSDKPPHVEDGKLIFRQIREHDLNKKNLDAVKHSFEESIYLNFRRHFKEGIQRIVSENPEYRK